MGTLLDGTNLGGGGGGSTPVSQQNVVYVAKSGDDGNTGINQENPFLTIGAAITYVNTQTPSDVSPWAIEVLDGAKYSESVTVPAFTTLNALQSTINGTITLTDATSHAYMIDDADDRVKIDGEFIGNVDGAASSTDNAIARYDGTTGKLIQNSVVTVDDIGNIAGSTIPASDASVNNVGFEVLTATDVQAALDETDTALFKARGTEVIGGTGAVTFTIGATTFDVAATQGQIKDSSGYYPIDFAGQTGVAIDGGATSSIYVYIDKAGNLQQQLTAPTCEEYREKLFLTRLVLLEGAGTLAAQEEISNPSGQYVNQLRDFVSYFPSQKKGLNLSGNASLTFQVAAGSIFELGINNSTNEDCPNELTFLAQDPTTFFYFKQDALISSGQTSINVTQYDNGGTLTTMTNNRFKIMTVYKFGSGNHVVQEGQAQYTSLDEAQTALSTRTFVENSVVTNGTRLGWIIVQKNATDLTNTSTSRIVDDTGAFGTATTTVGALLASNNLSDVADVGTSRTNLGLGTGDNVTFNNISPTGTVDGRDVATDGTKLDGIEAGAEVNNISDVNATDLTDGGDSTLHFHASDRARSNHTGTQTLATISDAGTIASQDANNVAITGGSVTGITDLAIADGGTGASTAPAALTNLGGIGAATTDTLTNKTFDANGTGNSLSNVDVADLANGVDGELITWDAAGAPATVATGTANQVLTSNGAGTAPTFQDAAGGGKVLQVVEFEHTSGTQSTTSSSFVDVSGFTTSITPTSTTSRIIVAFQFGARIDGTSVDSNARYRIVRDGSTNLAIGQLRSHTGHDSRVSMFLQDVDSPATTSPVTYKLQFERQGTGGGTTYVGNSTSDADRRIFLIEIGA